MWTGDVVREIFYAGSGFLGVRAFGYQLDYRADGYLPLSVRGGKKAWKVLSLGRLGIITFGRLESLT